MSPSSLPSQSHRHLYLHSPFALWWMSHCCSQCICSLDHSNCCACGNCTSCVAASSTPASIQNGINFLLCSGNILRSVPQNFQLIFLLEPAIFCKFCSNSQKKILTLKEILHEYLLHEYEYYATPEGVCVFWMLRLNRV